MKGGEIVSQPSEMCMHTRLEAYSEEWYKEVAEQLVKKRDEYVKNRSGCIVEAIKRSILS